MVEIPSQGESDTPSSNTVPSPGQVLDGHSAALTQRLVRRLTDPVGVVNLRSLQRQVARVPGWMVQRTALLQQVATRYSSSEQTAEQPDLVLVPGQRVQRQPLWDGFTSVSAATSRPPSFESGLADAAMQREGRSPPPAGEDMQQRVSTGTVEIGAKGSGTAQQSIARAAVEESNPDRSINRGNHEPLAASILNMQRPALGKMPIQPPLLQRMATALPARIQRWVFPHSRVSPSEQHPIAHAEPLPLADMARSPTSPAATPTISRSLLPPEPTKPAAKPLSTSVVPSLTSPSPALQSLVLPQRVQPQIQPQIQPQREGGSTSPGHERPIWQNSEASASPIPAQPPSGTHLTLQQVHRSALGLSADPLLLRPPDPSPAGNLVGENASVVVPAPQPAASGVPSLGTGSLSGLAIARKLDLSSTWPLVSGGRASLAATAALQVQRDLADQSATSRAPGVERGSLPEATAQTLAVAQELLHSPTLNHGMIWRKGMGDAVVGSSRGNSFAASPATLPAPDPSAQWLQRQVSTPTHSPPAVGSAPPPTAPAAPAAVNPAQITEQVSRMLARRLVIERERRGINLW